MAATKTKKRSVRRGVVEVVDPAKPARKPSKKKASKGRAKLQGAAGRALGIVAAVKKRVKGTAIGTLRDSDVMADITEWIPTGLTGLDEILGGGWGVGRASEVFGDEAAGKSALGHLAIREVQRMGGVAVLLDFEMALDVAKMKQLGIDPDTLIYSNPEHMQEGWEIVWSLHAELKKSPPEHPFLIVWDSVAAAPPKEELEADVDKAIVGVAARVMSRGCRRMLRSIAEVRAHMMWINQERLKIGMNSGPFGPTKQTSGGGGPKYASTFRVRNVKIETLKASTQKGARATGYKIRAITKKNRVNAPEQHCDWVIDFDSRHGPVVGTTKSGKPKRMGLGPNDELSIFHELKKAGRLRSAGGTYSPPWNRRKKFKRDEWVDLMQTDKDFRAGATESYLEVVEAGGAAVAKASGSKIKKKDEVEEDDD